MTRFTLTRRSKVRQRKLSSRNTEDGPLLLPQYGFRSDQIEEETIVFYSDKKTEKQLLSKEHEFDFAGKPDFAPLVSQRNSDFVPPLSPQREFHSYQIAEETTVFNPDKKIEKQRKESEFEFAENANFTSIVTLFSVHSDIDNARLDSDIDSLAEILDADHADLELLPVEQDKETPPETIRSSWHPIDTQEHVPFKLTEGLVFKVKRGSLSSLHPRSRIPSSKESVVSVRATESSTWSNSKGFISILDDPEEKTKTKKRNGGSSSVRQAAKMLKRRYCIKDREKKQPEKTGSSSEQIRTSKGTLLLRGRYSHRQKPPLEKDIENGTRVATPQATSPDQVGVNGDSSKKCVVKVARYVSSQSMHSAKPSKSIESEELRAKSSRKRWPWSNKKEEHVESLPKTEEQTQTESNSFYSDDASISSAESTEELNFREYRSRQRRLVSKG
jgi:hypothetical protein